MRGSGSGGRKSSTNRQSLEAPRPPNTDIRQRGSGGGREGGQGGTHSRPQPERETTLFADQQVILIYTTYSE